jgi:serine/threonine protein kinase
MAFSLKDFSDIRKIGEGGMGKVYCATQVSLNRSVVIKELAFNPNNDPLLIRKFENEAKSAAALDHENIIKVYDFGEDKGSFFISMEYIDGWDFEQLMHLRPFLKEIGMMVLLKALKGLHYAHQHGIVHCDVTPGNILVSKTGMVKVVDFGLAHASSQRAEVEDPATVFITPGYMPPEVALGIKTRDVTMDIWSAGVLAYKVISGKLPFAADNVRQVVYAISHEKEIDIQEMTPTLPDDCADAVRMYLQKDPKKRPKSLEKMIDSLENYLYDLGIRDIDKMIAYFIKDKDAAVAELTAPLLQYNLQKSNGLPESGKRAKSGVNLLDAEQYRALDTAPVGPWAGTPAAGPQSEMPIERYYPRTIPGIPKKTTFVKVRSLKSVLAFLGILSIVSLGAASVFVIVQKNRFSGQKTTLVMQKGPAESADLLLKSASARQPYESQKDSFSEYEVLSHELTPIVAILKNKPVPFKSTPKKTDPGVRLKSVERGDVTKPEEPHYGMVKVSRNPPQAKIFIDGINVSSSDLAGGTFLRPGTHVIAAVEAGYQAYSNLFIVQANSIQDIAISLKQIEKDPGFLHIYSYPWAKVFIDDVFEGTSPTPNPLELTEGNHSVVLKRDGYKPFSRILQVVQGETARIKVRLEPDDGGDTAARRAGSE